MNATQLTAAEVAFLEERRKGVGSTDCPAILGLSRWRSALDVYLEKVGEAPAADASPALHRGKFLEKAILARYAEEHGVALDALDVTLTRDGWRRAQVDALAADRLVEAKSVSYHAFHDTDAEPEYQWGAPGTDEIPRDYLVQNQWAADLASRERVDVVVAVLPSDPDKVLGRTAEQVVAQCALHVYPVERRPRVVDALVAACREFWFEHVQKGVPPGPPSYAEASTLWPRERRGTHVVATHDEARWLAALELGRLLAQHGKAIQEAAKLQLAKAMQSAESLLSPAGIEWATWRSHPRAGHYVAPSVSRRMNVTKSWKKSAQSNIAQAVAQQIASALASEVHLPPLLTNNPNDDEETTP